MLPINNGDFPVPSMEASGSGVECDIWLTVGSVALSFELAKISVGVG